MAKNNAEEIKMIKQKVPSAAYLGPDDTLPEYADYPSNTVMPVFATRVDSIKKDYREAKPHKHDEFELVYVVDGSATICTDMSTLHIEAGKGAFIKRGFVHSIEPDPDSSVSLEIIHFHHSLLFGPVAGILAGKYLVGILNSKEHDIFLIDSSNKNSEYVIGKMHEIYNLMQSGEFGSDLHVIADLYDIWATGISGYKIPPAAVLTRQQLQDQKRIARATAYIAEHYMEDILLSDIAEVCKVCNSECCRTFRRALHMSPMDYINRYRVYTAAEMLTQDESNTAMSEIAMNVGFNYASYFNKTFKRYLGMTPLQYRSIHNKKSKSKNTKDSFRI